VKGGPRSKPPLAVPRSTSIVWVRTVAREVVWLTCSIVALKVVGMPEVYRVRFEVNDRSVVGQPLRAHDGPLLAPPLGSMRVGRHVAPIL
jgi:hypothetical protein